MHELRAASGQGAATEVARTNISSNSKQTKEGLCDSPYLYRAYNLIPLTRDGRMSPERLRGWTAFAPGPVTC
jgi:hypothetical protein